ncbi:MAG: RNA polymerase sigma factor [Chitinophagaceae bacterium]|nr:RNA polymerase sigma factor [Chitinophagaceae bacterium]MCZ2397483.1 RNA polymerase sigma factor [Chitinophagales bacterium]
MTEEQMIQGCRENLPGAQKSLYKRHSAKMLGVCYRYARNQADAEDMLQEGFMKVFSQIHQFKGEGSLEGWVRTIMVHTCINHLKKNKKFAESVSLAYAEEVRIRDYSIPSLLQAKQVVECIRMLPLGYRTVLNLYAIEGFSHKEIGAILEIGESTSRSQYTRAKSLLEEILIKKKILTKPKEKLKMVSGEI